MKCGENNRCGPWNYSFIFNSAMRLFRRNVASSSTTKRFVLKFSTGKNAWNESWSNLRRSLNHCLACIIKKQIRFSRIYIIHFLKLIFNNCLNHSNLIFWQFRRFNFQIFRKPQIKLTAPKDCNGINLQLAKIIC